MPGRGDVGPSGFGGRLKVVRNEKGLTQKQLGESAGIHPNTIAKLERGDQEPNWPIVLKLAAALGVDCTAFSEGNDVAGGPAKKAAKPKSKGKAR